MTYINRLNALRAAFFAAACAIANIASADVFNFDGAVPVYDANRSTTVQDSGYHYYDGLADTATVGFNWSNSEYLGTWYYAWDGVNVSDCSDLNVDVDAYYQAGQKASYTSVTGTDAAGVVGGSYGVYYGNASYVDLGMSSSDAGMIVFNGLYDFTGISLSNTLVTYDYFTKNLTDDGDYYTQEVRIYGLDGNAEKTSNYVSVFLSEIDKVSNDWEFADLTSLNISEGLLGLYFEIWTDDYNQYGSLAPSYFALDNIVFAPIPEPATVAAVLGMAALGLAVARRRISK